MNFGILNILNKNKGDIIAIFEDKKKDKTSYLVMLDSTGENVVAYINPVKSVSNEVILKAMSAKGLKVEIRESAEEVLELTL